MLRAEIIDEGEFPFDQAMEEALELVIKRSLLVVRDNMADEIHHITYETANSLEVEQFKGFPAGKVFTNVPWNIKLEFHDSPFMRPGARSAKTGRDIRAIIKKTMGETWRAQIRKRKRRKISG